MLNELLEEINKLAKKKKEEGLTEEEEKRQKELYKEYIAGFRKNFISQLENTDVQYEDGTTVPLSDFKKKKDE